MSVVSSKKDDGTILPSVDEDDDADLSNDIQKMQSKEKDNASLLLLSTCSEQQAENCVATKNNDDEFLKCDESLSQNWVNEIAKHYANQNQEHAASNTETAQLYGLMGHNNNSNNNNVSFSPTIELQPALQLENLRRLTSKLSIATATPETTVKRPTGVAHHASVETTNEESQSPPLVSVPAPNEKGIIQTVYGPAVLLSHHTSSPIFQFQRKCNVRRDAKIAMQKDRRNDRKYQRWSLEEDELLEEALHLEEGPPYNWSRIASKYFSNSRSGRQCKTRWCKALRPGLIVGNWTEDEDNTIFHSKVDDDMRWTDIAKLLTGRTSEQVRERFVNYLNPNLKRSPWTEEEDRILFSQQRLLGNKWSEIAKLLPGRSENNIKNRWHNAKMAQKRKMRRQARVMASQLRKSAAINLHASSAHSTTKTNEERNEIDKNDSLVFASSDSVN